MQVAKESLHIFAYTCVYHHLLIVVHSFSKKIDALKRVCLNWEIWVCTTIIQPAWNAHKREALYMSSVKLLKCWLLLYLQIFILDIS
jgi:TRAP-type mannitol/chloroaromatic compound transport system permease small subunit